MYLPIIKILKEIFFKIFNFFLDFLSKISSSLRTTGRCSLRILPSSSQKKSNSNFNHLTQLKRRSDSLEKLSMNSKNDNNRKEYTLKTNINNIQTGIPRLNRLTKTNFSESNARYFFNYFTIL